MSLLEPELIITNPPPKSVRARYEKEGRGVIHGENGENVELQVKNMAGIKFTKCTAKVKSVSSRQPHGFYALKHCEWGISFASNGNAKVDLHDLAVVIKSGCTQKQKSDRGKFYLEFELISAEGYQRLTCRTDDILDESCKETCRPKIKSVNPRCAVGGEEVWIQCAGNVAKTKSVEAQLSGGILAGCKKQFGVKCEVDGKLVKFILPSLYEEFQIERGTEIQLRIVVDNDADISSDAITFEYLPEKHRRPKSIYADCIEEVQKDKGSRKRRVGGDSERSKTFDSETIIQCFTNKESSFVTGQIAPKCKSTFSISKPTRTFDTSTYYSKAFSEPNTWPDKKVETIFARQPTDIPNKVEVQTQANDKAIQDTVTFSQQNCNIPPPRLPTVIENEKQHLDELKPLQYQQNYGDSTKTLQSPEELPVSILSPNYAMTNSHLAQEQEFGPVINLTLATQENSMGTYNDQGLHRSKPPFSLPLPSPNSAHYMDPPTSSPIEVIDTHDDQCMDIPGNEIWPDMEVMITKVVSELNVGSTDNGRDVRSTESTLAQTTIPNNYNTRFDYNLFLDLDERPPEKVMKLDFE